MDVELDRDVLKGEVLQVTALRAKKLASLELADIVSIFKLSKKEYEEIIGQKGG